MSLEHRIGDLFTEDLDAIAHGVNCAAEMRSGIAVPMRVKYPDMFTRYVAECHDHRLAPGRVFPWRTRHGLWVYNMATQELPGANARLNLIEESVVETLARAADSGLRTVGVPRLGAGVGGLDWEDVLGVLESVTTASAVRLVVVTPPS